MKLSSHMTVSYLVASLYGCTAVSPQHRPSIDNGPAHQLRRDQPAGGQVPSA